MASKHSHHRNPIERMKHIRLQSIAVGPDDEVDIRNSSQLDHSKETPPTSNTNKSEQLSDDATMAKLSSSTIGDRVSWYDDLKSLVLLALPNSATFLINSLVGVTSVMFIGRIGAEYMGAAAIGTMLANLFGFSIGMGAASALDALCSQAYGAKQYQLVGRHTQRAMVVLTMACFPVAMIWMNAATILGWMGIEEVICKLAGQYVFILIIGMWPSFMFECLRRYLQCQSILWPIVVSAMSTAVTAIVLNYVLIFVLDMGFTGPAIATALSNWCLFLTCVLCIVLRRFVRIRRQVSQKNGNRKAGKYAAINKSNQVDSEESDIVTMSPPPPLSPRPISASPSPSPSPIEMATLKKRFEYDQSNSKLTIGSDSNTVVDASIMISSDGVDSNVASVVDPDDTWPSIFSMDIFDNWEEFLKLALPGSVSLFIEWGSYEVSASMAARLGALNLAVHSIFMQTAGLFYMIPLGLATAASIRVGQALGAGRGDRAKDVAKLALMLHVAYPLVSATFLIVVLRPYWGSIFSSDDEVIQACSHYLPIMMLYLFFDHVKCVCMAILRGCGRAPITVYGNTLSCWLVGFPFAWLLVFHNTFGLWGLWTAMSSSWLAASLIYYIVILRTDWTDQVEQAKKRTERSITATMGGH